MLPFSPLSRRKPADAPCVANMWDLSRRGVNWLHVLSTCCILWAVTCPAAPSESRAHAVELAAAETEASAPKLPERQASGARTAIERTAPAKAYALLEALRQRNGEPLAGYVGGKVFQNRAARAMRNGLSSSKIPARPITRMTITVRSFR